MTIASAPPVSDHRGMPRAGVWLAALRHGMVALGLALALLVLGIECARYLALDAYIDHIESTIATGGWEYLHGTPLYAIDDGAPSFANIYGPLAYLAEVPAFLIAGPGIMASKIAAIAALAATLLLMGGWLARMPRATAVNSFFFLVAGLLAFSPWCCWARADALEVLLVAVAVVSGGGPLALGICIGLAVNLKVHAFLYFLPIAVELWRRRGWRPLFLAGAIAGVAFVAPFLLPGVSLPDYLLTVGQQVAGRHHTAEQVAAWTAYFLLLALPVGLPLRRREATREARIYALSALASLAGLLYVATFPGAGYYHLLPMLPVLVAARRRLPLGGTAAQFAPFPLLLIAAVTAGGALDQFAQRAGWGARADEAVDLALAGPSRPADIGYGISKEGYEIAQLAKAKLAFRGSPPWVDAQILMELRQIGFDGSRRWVPYVAECRVARFVLPKGEAPFATRSYFYDRGELFDGAFRDAFAAHYRPVAESAHFTAWECRDGKS